MTTKENDVFCEGCGTRLGAGAAFCSGCGRGKATPPVGRAVTGPAWAPAGPDPRLLSLPSTVAPPGAVIGSDSLQVPLASFGQRWGAAVLDNLVFWFTLGVGWLIWAWFTSAEGQTPGKKMVGLRVVGQDTGGVVSRGQAFARGVLKNFLDVLSMFLFYIPMLVGACMFFADPLRRTPWDRAMSTLVVWDPSGKTLQQVPQSIGTYASAGV